MTIIIIQDMTTTRLGDALLESQILDYDLVRQLKEEMNKLKVFRGYSNNKEEEEEGDEPASEVIQWIRSDIRYFKWRHGVVGHTSVVWNYRHVGEYYYDGDETRPITLVKYQTAKDLLDAVESTDTAKHERLPSALLYALAAILEGCSFINAPDYLLKCQGFMDVVNQQVGVYCVGGGNDFFTGFVHQAIVDSMKERGMLVEDMSSSSTNTHTITARAFLDQPHTVITIPPTIREENMLRVPLLMDAAVLCDFFSSKSWPHDNVAKALSYLFVKSSSSSTKIYGMYDLQTQLQAASIKSNGSDYSTTTKTKKRVRIRLEEKTTEWAIPHDARIICAGLACVDMQLHQATGGNGGESIETFQGETSIGGGSVSMACQTLARLCHGAPLEDGFYMQVTPPVVHSVIPLCKIGNDDTGNKLLSFMEKCGSACRNVNTKYIRMARNNYDSKTRTALAVLPIYKDGRRGCFFDAASNDTFSANDMKDMIHNLANVTKGLDHSQQQLSNEEMELYHDRVDGATPPYGAFLFGYPHLLPLLRGEALAQVFVEARSIMVDGGLIVMDLNGVPDLPQYDGGVLRTASDLRKDRVIGAALEHVDILHMNDEELQLLTGCQLEGFDVEEDENIMKKAVHLFLQCGVAIVVVTRGQKGSFVHCNDESRFAKSEMLPHSWIDCTAKINAVELPRDAVINSNGAGDSFTAGFLVAAMLRHTGLTLPSTPTPKIVSSSNNNVNNNNISSLTDLSDRSMDMGGNMDRLPSPSKSPIKFITPYQLYMRENYVSLKKQCNDDKKAIFSRCHEMWEHETDEVKFLYSRRATEENETAEENDVSMQLQNVMLAFDTCTAQPSVEIDDTTNQYMANRALTLESAVQFASLVAAHHVDMLTRNLRHIDVTRLLERSMIFPDGLEEI